MLFRSGATSQLGAYSSSGVLTVGDVAEEAEEESTGGWYFRYEQEQYRLADERRKRKKTKEEAQRIEDELIKAIALEERKIEEREARDNELDRLTKLAERHIDEITETNNAIGRAAIQAIESRKFGEMEKLERLLKRQYEEEQFLIEATRLIING